MAAQMGLVSEKIYGEGKAQKSVGFFYQFPNGRNALWSAVLHGDLKDIRITLDQLKLRNRTLIPHQDGWQVIVCSKRSKIPVKAIEIKKSIKTSEERFVLGIFQYLGARTREQAKKIYEEIIQGWERKTRHMGSSEQQEQFAAGEDTALDFELLDRLIAQGIPEAEIPLAVLMKDKWFLKEDPQWDTKTKILAEHLREEYEWFYKSPEEKARELEEAKKLEEQLRLLGVQVIDSAEPSGGAIVT
ncbi:MAG: hypothetical protein RMI90_00665 [Thermoguttaceae bacterium]|nr:hypothetical protein [Thermoguttaceae bacterium]